MNPLLTRYCSEFGIAAQSCGTSAFVTHVVFAGTYTVLAVLISILSYKHRRKLPHYGTFLVFLGFLLVLAVNLMVRILFQIQPSPIALNVIRFGFLSSFLGALWRIKELVPLMKEAYERLSELAIARSQARYRSLVDVIAEVVWIEDKSGNFEPESCAAWTKLTGLACNKTENFDRFEALHPDDRYRAHLAWQQAVFETRSYKMHYRLWIESQQQYRWFESRGVPVRDDEGRVTEWIGIVVDIHEHYTREQALQLALQNAQDAAQEAIELKSLADQANKAKSDFLAVMSHELRTPLTATVGFGELLADGVLGELSKEQRDAVRRIQMSAQHLVGMIDQILDFSGIESGKILVKAEVVPVHRLCREVVDLIRPMVVDRKLNLLANVDKLLLMSTDPQKLRQILLNLMTNAVKFTTKGSVMLMAYKRDDQIVFQVSDTGIGIPVEYQEKIFEQFWQVRQGLTRNVGGAGLGLTICKRFVEALNGEIYLKSISEEEHHDTNESPGSTFTVILPSNMPQSQVAENEAERSA